jgi:cytidylate kinase
LEVKLRKQLKPCPICGRDIGVHIITAENCNGKVYRGICWGNRCKHKLPTDWYEKRKDAVEAWNSLNSNEFVSMNCDNEKISTGLLQKNVDEIISVITECDEFDQAVLENKLKEIIRKNCQYCHCSF